MSLTNAEKQKRYRDNKNKRGRLGDSRINTFVTFETAQALGRLSNHYGLTKREILELLIKNADESVVNNIADVDSTEWKNYFDIHD
ncbi:TPA: hypothetical protein ACJHAA_004381 [Salmonella enterica subsp. enterica serovar Onderstepoort]